MSSFPFEVGRVVFSRAGRDQGHYFVIVAVLDKDHVAVANGCQRKVDHPKKKKIKHLVAKPEVIEELREKIFAKKRIFDSEVRNKLDAIGYQEGPRDPGDPADPRDQEGVRPQDGQENGRENDQEALPPRKEV